MADAKERSDWGRASSLMALMANLNRDPKKRGPFKPSEFSPPFGAGKAEVARADISVLKTVFIDKKVPGKKK